MSEEILINITPMESRVAVVENGVLQEVHVERTQRRGIVGNIYKGKVVRVLPGMQAAFIDIGLDRAAFIHASEISMREGPAVETISSLSMKVRVWWCRSPKTRSAARAHG